MRIRIGNDIKLRLSVTIRNGISPNVLSAKVYIVNRTAQKAALSNLNKKTKFLSRFPIGKDFDCKLNGLEPSDYNINIIDGNMPYHCYPHNHIKHPFNGFGIYPAWDKVYTPVIDNCDLTSYQPEIKFTNIRNVIEVLFPAEAQLYTGDYDVIVVARLYDPNYFNNSKTITVDYKNLITLVASTEEADDNTEIHVIPEGDTQQQNDNDIYITSARFDEDNDKLIISRNDGYNISVDITSSPKWYE